MYNEKIRIGTLVNARNNAPDYISKILPYGFESFSLTFWETTAGIDIEQLAVDVKEVLDGSDAIVSSISVYGNPLMYDEKSKETRDGWKRLIDSAHLFGCNVVTGFTGRIIDKPIDESIQRYAEVFTPLASQAKDCGVRLAFENCDMGGDWYRGNWNIAHGPSAWELMFNAIPHENIGLEWEPCHQMVKLVDPLPQMRKWVSKIFHIHGKDATILWDVIKEYGIHGPKEFAFHRTPGFGDSNWTDIISELRRADFKGSIDIEGWHDPVYRDILEMTGQVYALNHLKQCRGGAFIPNPN